MPSTELDQIFLTMLANLRPLFKAAAAAEDTGAAKLLFEKLNETVTSILDEAEDLHRRGEGGKASDLAFNGLSRAMEDIEADMKKAAAENPRVQEVYEFLENEVVIETMDLINESMEAVNKSVKGLSDFFQDAGKRLDDQTAKSVRRRELEDTSSMPVLTVLPVTLNGSKPPKPQA
jgi:hypothetical protein